MAIGDYGEKPFGMREIKVTPESGGGAAQALKREQVLSFTPVYDTEELGGEDVTKAVGSHMTHVEWALEEGGVPLMALKAMVGGTLSATGTSKYQLARKGTDTMPYFKLEGRAIAPDGGDFHIILHKCKVTSGPDGSLEKGAFWVSSLSGLAIDNGVAGEGIYTAIQNETAEAIS